MEGFEPEEEDSKTRSVLWERVYRPKETVSRNKGEKSIILYQEVSIFQEKEIVNMVKTNTSSIHMELRVEATFGSVY